jgi:hypothetical protein
MDYCCRWLYLSTKLFWSLLLVFCPDELLWLKSVIMALNFRKSLGKNFGKFGESWLYWFESNGCEWPLRCSCFQLCNWRFECISLWIFEQCYLKQFYCGCFVQQFRIGKHLWSCWLYWICCAGNLWSQNVERVNNLINSL